MHTDSRPFLVTVLATLIYCAYLGSQWLPLEWSDKEMSASASRVWDVKQELTEHHRLAWWTPYFMSGSSYGLNHARGFYLLPWMALSAFTDLQRAGKLMALLAMFAGTLGMFGCARHFLRNGWAAMLAALTFLLHPQQIARAAGSEHMTIALSFVFIPLMWWTFARALETGKLNAIFLCALVTTLAMWTDTKQAVIHLLFLSLFVLSWLIKDWRSTLRTCGLLAGFGAGLGLGIVMPGLIESKYVKLFEGDPLTEWQKAYSFKSLLPLVDREGVVTKSATQNVTAQLNRRGGVGTPAEAESARRVFSLQMDSPEKYAGIVLFALIAVTILWNRRRVNRQLFWLFVALLLSSVMLATGPSSLLSANLKTFDALARWNAAGPAVWLSAAALVAFLVIFAQRKLTTSRKWLMAGGALVVVLFVPAFGIISHFPYFKDIRAPFSFYDGPSVFFGAMLAGFFVSDVLSGRHVSKIVAGIAVLLLLDYWPYQKPMKETPVSAQTFKNFETTYAALSADSDWVKTYSISGRYFHLLGPKYSGKPQVWEAFYNWMSPLGTGLINRFAGLEMFNLLGARYIICDKADTDPKLLADLGSKLPVASENPDFVTYRNDSARPYVTGYERACLFVGDVKNSPQIALALSVRDWPLVHSDRERAGNFERTYREGSPVFPPLSNGKPVELTQLRLTRSDHQTVRVNLTTAKPCLVVINESYYPFWRASVDGRPAEVLRVSCALMGVELPAGAHEIVLHYETPRVYLLAGIVSALTLLAGIVLLVCRIQTTNMRPWR